MVVTICQIDEDCSFVMDPDRLVDINELMAPFPLEEEAWDIKPPVDALRLAKGLLFGVPGVEGRILLGETEEIAKALVFGPCPGSEVLLVGATVDDDPIVAVAAGGVCGLESSLVELTVDAGRGSTEAESPA